MQDYTALYVSSSRRTYNSRYQSFTEYEERQNIFISQSQSQFQSYDFNSSYISNCNNFNDYHQQNSEFSEALLRDHNLSNINQNQSALSALRSQLQITSENHLSSWQEQDQWYEFRQQDQHYSTQQQSEYNHRYLFCNSQAAYAVDEDLKSDYLSEFRQGSQNAYKYETEQQNENYNTYSEHEKESKENPNEQINVMFVMLILAVCSRCNVNFTSENALHKHILKCVTKLKLVWKESVSINFAKSDQIIKSKTLVSMTKKFEFRIWNYATVKAQISQWESVHNMCINSECTMSLINQKFLMENVSNVIIKKVNTSLTVRDISSVSHNAEEFVLLSIYIKECLNRKFKIALIQ